MSVPAPRVQELAYAVVGATDVGAWEDYGRDLLGAEVVRFGDGAALRIDERPFRLAVEPAEVDGLATLGWLTADEAGLRSVAAAATEQGFSVSEMDADLLARRQVGAGITFEFTDGPLKVVQEVVVGITDAGPAALSPEVTGFVTGRQGMGHAVFACSEVDVPDALYCGTYGTSLREDIKTIVGRRGHFYACNPRHHCAAVVEDDVPAVQHIMLEMRTFDDVGCAYDRFQKAGLETTGLGRHRTDHMFSFYVGNPGGFSFEIGTDGFQIEDPDTWLDIKESSRYRAWGHQGLATHKPEEWNAKLRAAEAAEQ